MNRDIFPDGSASGGEVDALRQGSPDTRGGAMVESRRHRRGGRAATIAAATAVALAATALAVNWQARRIERRHPPKGQFVDVDGVRLHYIEAGQGDPVVLLHGNGSLLEDPLLSIFAPLAEHHRVIAFDRPGFGWSERPRDREWTPEAQATLFRDAFHALGIERPVLYGHSFGAPVVLSFAMMHPEDTRGIVAASGYYYPNLRADSIIAWSATLPLIGPILRNTLLPVEGAMLGNVAVKALFDPAPVPETYEIFPAGMSLRPSQIRASGEDGRTLRAWAKRARPNYKDVRVPVVIVAGTDDRIVDPVGHSCRLHRDIPESRLHLWLDTGHMVHHTRADEVVDAIAEAFGMADTWAAPIEETQPDAGAVNSAGDPDVAVSAAPSEAAPEPMDASKPLTPTPADRVAAAAPV